MEENLDSAIKHVYRLISRIQENPDQRSLIIQDFCRERAEAGEKDTAHLVLLMKSLMDQEDQNTTPSLVPALTQPTLYISYAWGDAQETSPSREDIVDQLYQSLIADGYSVRRDKTDLGYKGLIGEFMKEIGQGHLIVVVISDKYLKSLFCMYELLEISRNQDHHDRIFPIVFEDAAIRTLAGRLAYLQYWKNEFENLTPIIKDVTELLPADSGSFQEYKKYQDIAQHADSLLTYLANINTQTPELLSANDFNTLKRAIDTRLQALARQS